ncbi:hypothetical protein [Piscinibacter sakaiensis]|uniref:Uncharacterized protein n=1 Tax=Piscinibacter sakaiensis TaxID=1547922 RepID=A0A0K8P4H7_PISS1|nr:hypothetical protein [Piscinibacter sakaiensis]GAP37557.1 hypothetical protein ISF6_3502 [Piscinibacter sakaiensis]
MNGDSAGADPTQWHELLASVGAEVAAPLTLALERIQAMVATGRIDAEGLAGLRTEVEAARRVGITAQQLSRFASRRLRLSHERLPLTELLREVLQHRARDAAARGCRLDTSPRPKDAEVLADPTLLQGLLDSLVDWALQHAAVEVLFDVSIKTWPAHARLSCSFALPQPEDGRPPEPPSADTLAWRLIEQIAHTMDLLIERPDEAGRVVAVFEFPRTANNSLEGASSIDLSDDAAPGPSSLPLVGSRVLVIASRREVRARIRDAIHHMGLAIDLVSSIAEAEEFCRDGLPDGVIVEGILAGERLARLQSELWAEVPTLAFVEIVEEGDAYEMSDAANGRHVARVGRAALDTALPSVLLFELSKAL